MNNKNNNVTIENISWQSICHSKNGLSYWLTGALYGLIVGILFWAFVFAYATLTTDFGFVPYLIDYLGSDVIRFGVALLVVVSYFMLFGILMGLNYSAIRKNRHSTILISGNIGATFAFLILFLSSTLGRLVQGRPYNLLNLDGALVRIIVVVLVGYSLGLLAGFVNQTARKRKL